MSRYILIHRLRFPAFLLLVGVIELMHRMGIVSSFWRFFWPMALILLGVLMLAERAAIAAEGYPQYPGGCCGGAFDPNGPTGVPPNPGQSTAIVPAEPHDFGKNPDGGQL